MKEMKDKDANEMILYDCSVSNTFPPECRQPDSEIGMLIRPITTPHINPAFSHTFDKRVNTRGPTLAMSAEENASSTEVGGMNPTVGELQTGDKKENSSKWISSLNSKKTSAQDKRKDSDEVGDLDEMERYGLGGYLDEEEIGQNNSTRRWDVQTQMSLSTPIPETNIGYQLLKKMGWKNNTGLGREEQGMIEPIPINLGRIDLLGIGKQEQDEEYAENTAAKRRTLESEMILTEEQKKARMEVAEKKEVIKQELQEINRPFYCELCDKQYKNVTEMEVHLSSYDHNHKKRFKEMKQLQNTTKQGGDAAKRKREDKESERMKKMAAAMAQAEQEAIQRAYYQQSQNYYQQSQAYYQQPQDYQQSQAYYQQSQNYYQQPQDYQQSQAYYQQSQVPMPPTAQSSQAAPIQFSFSAPQPKAGPIQFSLNFNAKK